MKLERHAIRREAALIMFRSITPARGICNDDIVQKT